MQAKIIRRDKSIELPIYHTKESAGFDIASTADVLVEPNQVVRIPTGLIIQAPVGHFLQIASRSSLPLKKGLMLANGIGVVDRDYCGPEDELSLAVYNFGEKSVEIKKGERIAQGLFLPVEQVEWQETNEIADVSRGGYGSSGGYSV